MQKGLARPVLQGGSSLDIAATWRSKGTTQSDNIADIEVMTDQLEPEHWKSLRERLKSELSQEQVVIRAQTIKRL